jgi:hypothetical protein
MRAVLRTPARVWEPARAWLLDSTEERLAYLLARVSVLTDPWRGPTVDLLVGYAILVPDSALAAQSPVRVEVDPAFTRAVLVGCYETGLSLIDVHTHPFATTRVAFSGTDTANMCQTHAEFRREIPQDPPALAASLVVGRDSVVGAWLPPGEQALLPLARMQLTGTRIVEVPLCTP